MQALVYTDLLSMKRIMYIASIVPSVVAIIGIANISIICICLLS